MHGLHWYGGKWTEIFYRDVVLAVKVCFAPSLPLPFMCLCIKGLANFSSLSQNLSPSIHLLECKFHFCVDSLKIFIFSSTYNLYTCWSCALGILHPKMYMHRFLLASVICVLRVTPKKQPLNRWHLATHSVVLEWVIFKWRGSKMRVSLMLIGFPKTLLIQRQLMIPPLRILLIYHQYSKNLLRLTLKVIISSYLTFLFISLGIHIVCHTVNSLLYPAGEDDSLPGIEDLQITGDAFPGKELQACGISINGTTSCNFEVLLEFRLALLSCD